MTNWLRILSTTAVLLAAGALGAGSAAALPLLTLDLDPGTAAVEATRTVTRGAVFSILVRISDVEPAAPLDAFEFDIAYDPSILRALGVEDAGFLPAPPTVLSSQLFPELGFAETGVGSAGQSGSGALARIEFEALLLGTTPLDLNDVLISAPFGVIIEIGGLLDGTIEVVPVPEPSTLPSLVGGLALLGGMRRRPREHERLESSS